MREAQACFKKLRLVESSSFEQKGENWVTALGYVAGMQGTNPSLLKYDCDSIKPVLAHDHKTSASMAQAECIDEMAHL